jgi:hypothetical protein
LISQVLLKFNSDDAFVMTDIPAWDYAAVGNEAGNGIHNFVDLATLKDPKCRYLSEEDGVFKLSMEMTQYSFQPPKTKEVPFRAMKDPLPHIAPPPPAPAPAAKLPLAVEEPNNGSNGGGSGKGTISPSKDSKEEGQDSEISSRNNKLDEELSSITLVRAKPVHVISASEMIGFTLLESILADSLSKVRKVRRQIEKQNSIK